MTFKPAFRILVASIAVASAPAIAQNIAVVNGKGIPTARADAIVKQVVAQGQQKDSPELRDLIKKDLISREVLMQEAEKQGYAKSADVKQQMENARQALVVQAMVGDYVKKNPVKEADVKAEYDRFVKETGDKEYHVRHILLENEADAKAVIAKLKGGAKFEELAKQSKDPGSAANGGDLDWAPPSAFVKPFSDAMTALQKGQFTETPVQTQFGYHVIKLEDSRAAKVPSFEEVKPQIAESLQQQKLQAYQQELKKKAKIQ